MLALVREVSPELTRCELTLLERLPIDAARAARQHRGYTEALQALGCTLEWLPPLPESPDSVFVEDTAVVLDGIAIVTRPGASSRRGETPSVAAALGRYRPLSHITAPGCLDGGDVLRIGRTSSVAANQDFVPRHQGLRHDPGSVQDRADVSGKQLALGLNTAFDVPAHALIGIGS